MVRRRQRGAGMRMRACVLVAFWHTESHRAGLAGSVEVVIVSMMDDNLRLCVLARPIRLPIKRTRKADARTHAGAYTFIMS